MIQEAYVSFEVAKLLKEKGFNENCHSHYWLKENNTEPSIYIEEYLHDWNESLVYVSRPTHQMTLAWLREVKGIYISIRFGGYCWRVDILDKETEKWIDKDICEEKHEDAVEAAIKYALENLI